MFLRRAQAPFVKGSRIDPGSKEELEQGILWTASQIEEVIRGRYESILIVGGAARGESTFDPEGRLLSDVDFTFVLPERNPVTAWLAVEACRGALRRSLPLLETMDWITMGYAYHASRFWKMATPYMLELKTNSRILFGSPP